MSATCRCACCRENENRRDHGRDEYCNCLDYPPDQRCDCSHCRRFEDDLTLGLIQYARGEARRWVKQVDGTWGPE